MAKVLVVHRGIRKIRLTGGEPLVRRGLLDLVRMLREVPGLEVLALSTDGQRLAETAEPLRRAGISCVNISLDSLEASTFSRITRGGDLSRTLAGLDAALAAGFECVKVNTVVLRGINDHEIGSFVRLALQKGVELRFLELMPLGGPGQAVWEHFCPVADIRAALSREGRLEPLPQTQNGVAEPWLFQQDGRAAILGFISPMSRPFCSTCSRMRLSAAGRLLPCLMGDSRVDLMPALRPKPDEGEILRRYDMAVGLRVPEHAAAGPVPMACVGG